MQVIALQAQRLAGCERLRLCCRRRRLLLRLGRVLELVRERGLALNLGVLMVRGLGRSVTRMVRNAARLVRGPADELLLEVLGAEDGYLGEEELALDAVRVGVVEYGPYGDLDR